jgi:hypothetical protein
VMQGLIDTGMRLAIPDQGSTCHALLLSNVVQNLESGCP